MTVHEDPRAQMAYEANNGTGTTANAYATALDLDLRGKEGGTIELANTHAANGLTRKVEVRDADYDNSTWREIVAEGNLAAETEEVLAQLEKTYARVRVRVKSQVEESAATYRYRYLTIG